MVSRMLCPPGWDGCVRNKEGQVGEIPPAMIGPPFRGEAQQDLDDVAEPDIGRGCYLFARRRRKHDFGQEQRWHGNDRGIALEDGAVATASGNPSGHLVDRGYASAEMDRGTVPAAFGCEV